MIRSITGLFLGSRMVFEKREKYPKAMTMPGIASGSITRRSSRFLPFSFVLARRNPMVKPISRSIRVLAELKSMLLKMPVLVRWWAKTVP